jgi:hypothetical protein
MPSLIDPTKPADGMPANKDDIRANFTAARQEIEHGGFYTGLAGTERPVRDYIVGRPVDVREFGATGNGTIDDHPPLQQALAANVPLFFPPGDYRISQPLIYTGESIFWYGSGTKAGAGRSRIIGNFSEPLLHRAGVWVSHEDTLNFNPVDVGTGVGFIIQDLHFRAEHPFGCCIQIYNNSAPFNAHRCQFDTNFRGLILLQSFDALVTNCRFGGAHFTVHTIADGVWERAYALYGGHMTAIGCSFQGCGTGIYAVGAECNHYGHRIEVNGYGLLVGGNTLAPDVFGIFTHCSHSHQHGMTFESNHIGIRIRSANNGYHLSDCALQGGTNGPQNDGDGKGRAALWIDGMGRNSRVSNIQCSGFFKTASMVFGSGCRGIFEGLSPGQSEPNRPSVGGSSNLIAKRSTGGISYGLSRVAVNPSAGDGVENQITADSSLHLRGLKGLNIRDQAQPNNLGGMVEVTETATSHAVAFRSERGPGHAAFSSNPAAVNDAGSSLASGTYYYAATQVGPRGETGVDSVNEEGNNYRSVEVTSGQRVDMTAHGGNPYAYRWYRGRALGVFEGYVETESNTFSDNGQVSFVGGDMPPRHTLIPSEHEPDHNYAVVATPSWPTTIWVTDKTTTGFVLNFGTAAPAGATVQWLLFRP